MTLYIPLLFCPLSDAAAQLWYFCKRKGCNEPFFGKEILPFNSFWKTETLGLKDKEPFYVRIKL